jgi:hypothetical protein
VSDAGFVLDAYDLEARRALLHQERLDRRAALGPIERRPHHHGVRALAGGHENLLAVEDVVVAVGPCGRGDGGGVRAAARLVDRHRGPHPGEALELLLVRDRGDRGVAETLPWHRQQQPDVAPAHFDRAEHEVEIRAVAVADQRGDMTCGRVSAAFVVTTTRAPRS